MGGEAGQELFNIGLPLERLRSLVGQGKTVSADGLPRYSEATRHLVKLAEEVARDQTVIPKHLLLAITRQPPSKAFEILRVSGELEKLLVFLQP